MSKYVMIAFDDDKDAENFVSSFEQGKVFFEVDNGDGTGVYGYLDTAKAFIRGVWKRPTKACTCIEDNGNKIPKNRSVVRGKKWQWSVCNICGRPDAYWMRLPGALNFIGRNLLPVSKRAPEWRGDKVPAEHVFDHDKNLWQNVNDGEYLGDSVLKGVPVPDGLGHIYLKTENSL